MIDKDVQKSKTYFATVLVLAFHGRCQLKVVTRCQALRPWSNAVNYNGRFGPSIGVSRQCIRLEGSLVRCSTVPVSYTHLTKLFYFQQLPLFEKV